MEIGAMTVSTAIPKETMQMQGGVGGGVRALTGGTQPTAAPGGTPATGKVYDVKDLNKDGVVSDNEEVQYAMLHPTDAQNSQTSGLSAGNNTAQSYNAQGQMAENAGGTQNILNLMA